MLFSVQLRGENDGMHASAACVRAGMPELLLSTIRHADCGMERKQCAAIFAVCIEGKQLPGKIIRTYLTAVYLFDAQDSKLPTQMQHRVYAQAPHDDILIHRHDVEPQPDAGPAPPHVFGEVCRLWLGIPSAWRLVCLANCPLMV